MKCTTVFCDKVATMTLDILLLREAGRAADAKSYPYCDEHLGMFYRTFTTMPGIVIEGISVLDSPPYL